MHHTRAWSGSSDQDHATQIYWPRSGIQCGAKTNKNVRHNVITARSHLNEIWRLRFKLKEEEGARWSHLLRWLWLCRRRRQSPEFIQNTTKLNKIYMVLFVFSQGIQICK
jgi:hypothetical protein